MSWFDNAAKDNLLEEVSRFLEDHSIAALMEVITQAIYRKENDCL